MLRSTGTGAVCMLAAAALLAGCQRSESVDRRSPPEPLRLEAAKGSSTSAPPAAAAPAPKSGAKKTRSPKPAPPAPAPKEQQPAERVDATAHDVDTTAHEDDRREDENDPIVTTISGCLERHKGDRFRLTDMIGEHAPKSRSWKTGFFRKGSAKLDLIDETSRLKLASHVGYRVDVTGALFKKVMRARTMTPTTARCS